ncbi:MAG: hypothetical protein PVF43_06445 [Candidatus Eiseniibacteriota bacterium]|jgi:hypothetical protein
MMVRSGSGRWLTRAAVPCAVVVMMTVMLLGEASAQATPQVTTPSIAPWNAGGSGDAPAAVDGDDASAALTGASGWRWSAPAPGLAPRRDVTAPASSPGAADLRQGGLSSLPGHPATRLADDIAADIAAGVAAGAPTDGVQYIDERGAPHSDGRPSRGRTILYSALVPGLGQLKWGSRPVGVALMLGEVASWTSFITFRAQGASRKDRYIDYAERFAGISDADGEADSYFQSLARYDRSDPGPGSYNEIEVRLVAIRELYPDDPVAQQRYIEENSITGNLAWDWESEARRLQFADLRSSSESAYHRADFSIGGMVAGRILSLMHAIWLTAERPGDDDEQDSDDGPHRDGDHSLAQTLSPYVHTGLDGDCRVGLRARF